MVTAWLSHLIGRLSCFQYTSTRGESINWLKYVKLHPGRWWHGQLFEKVTILHFPSVHLLQNVSFLQLRQHKLCLLIGPKNLISCSSPRDVDSFVVVFFFGFLCVLLRIYVIDDFRINAQCEDCGAFTRQGHLGPTNYTSKSKSTRSCIA